MLYGPGMNECMNAWWLNVRKIQDWEMGEVEDWGARFKGSV